MSISHYGGMIGYKQNPTRISKKTDLTVGCPACGASKGSNCRDRFGVMLVNQAHAARKAHIRAMGGAK